jgi:beta-fructofuranosidase
MMQRKIDKSTRALKRSIAKAQADPLRPRFHFAPPANWMNDPNGTIFHNGEYHLFYQFNPARPKWGNLHWGHAKSTNLVDWDHLPIALAPDGFPGEVHCWSGCCVIAPDGTPTIFYTSMNPRSLLLTRAKRYAQQWIATGSPDLVTWQKHAANPILSETIHGDQIPEHWRDPYIWRDDRKWWMVLCGQFKGEKFGRVLLYESENLSDWAYSGVLATGTPAEGRGWECANYFPLGEKFVLVVSPYDPVLYSVGDFEDGQHKNGSWFTLDHGKAFYATNTFVDDQDRTILVGWVRAKGEGWNGCLSLPRWLELGEEGQLFIRPVPELKKLRQHHISYQRELKSLTEQAGTAPIFGEQVEIKAHFMLDAVQRCGFRLMDDEDAHLIAYDGKSHTLDVFGVTAQLQFVAPRELLELHVFVDSSVVEIFINQREVFTAHFTPVLAENHALKIAPFIENGIGKFSVDIWKLDPAQFNNLS